MNRRDADLLFVAAADDPVLAAWASVVHEYRMPAACDVSPHDHWAAYQELYTYGLISPTQYDETNVKREFFSGCRPSVADVQSTLNNMKILRSHDLPMEEPMSKAKPPTAAFANPAALATRDAPPSGLTQIPPRPGVTGRQPPSSITAFQPQREVLPAAPASAPIRAFGEPQQPAGLPCTTSGRATEGIDSGLSCDLICNGPRTAPHQPQSLQLIDDGGEFIDQKDMPNGEEFSLLEYVFHAECPLCGSIYHTSVGQPIARGEY